ncbi:AsmA protein [Kushneria sinocarnis]|uniref:AsmA protein n=1 Tax=Kushneria sinocarnis TaxID=595502 RepID=A0A420WSU7_9GAMM|nr:AsmA family protein [Kushneria sinocarnis]RKQ95759.1 AsmA protein [Kushneria sinocarnis]
MKRLFRILLAGIGVLALLAVAGVVYVTTFVDPNDLKPRLVEAVEERTGLNLSLNGPISWTFYPRLGVTVEDAVARLPDQDQVSEPFAAFDRADVKVRLAPLITGDVSVDGVTLDGLKLNLVRDAEGHGNWQTLAEETAERAEQGADDSRPPQSGNGSQGGVSHAAERPLSVDIASVEVINGRVHYLDRQKHRDATLSKLNLGASNVSLNDDFPLQLSFDMASVSPALNGHLELGGSARLNLREQRYAMNGFTLETDLQLPMLNDTRSQHFSLTGDRLAADIASRHYQLEGGALAAELHLAADERQTLPLQANFNAEADLGEGTARLNDLVITSGNELHLAGGLQASSLTDNPSWQGELHLDPLNLRQWLGRFGRAPESADAQTLTRVAFDTRLEGSRQLAAFHDLSLRVDDTTLTGSVGVGMHGERLNFDLTGNTLDLDRYLPPREQAGAQEDRTAMLELMGVRPALAASEGAELLPVELLRSLTLDGRLRLDALAVHGAKLSGVLLKVAGSDGRHRLEQLTAGLYNGTFNASGTLDVRQTPLQLTFKEQLEGVQLQPLLADVARRGQLMRGTLTLDGQFRSRTNRLDTLTRNLNGKASMRVTDGALLGANISQQLCTAAAALQGRSSDREWSDDTPFETLSATATITDGVVNNDDLQVAIPGIELSGRGQANLATHRFAYQLGARFVDTADSQACRVTDALSQVRLPVQCAGDFSDPPAQWCHFDRDAFGKVLTKMAASKGQRELGDQLDRQLDGKLGRKLEEKLGEEGSRNLRDRLEGLFK